LEIVTRGREVLSIRGDEQDVFSHGYICPKAYSLKELDADRDCIREPMMRRGDQWLKVSWDDAFAEVERGLLLGAHLRGPGLGLVLDACHLLTPFSGGGVLPTAGGPRCDSKGVRVARL